MATVKVYDQNKQECGELTLSADVFEVEARPEILNLVVRAQMAAKRAGTHMAKTRAFVSGGGVKPWKQKGTGRARSGSNRSPVWRGGAIVFGPQPRDYSFKLNSKVRALAMKMALSSRLAAENLLGHDGMIETLVGQDALEDRGHQSEDIVGRLAFLLVGGAVGDVGFQRRPEREGAAALRPGPDGHQRAADVGVHDQRIGLAIGVLDA